MTLREYINFWQETYDKHQSRPTTYAAHGYIFKNHIIPGLGDIPLSELTVEKIEDFLEAKVNLKLWVKVKKDWRDSDFLLKNFGFKEND